MSILTNFKLSFLHLKKKFESEGVPNPLSIRHPTFNEKSSDLFPQRLAIHVD